MGSCRNAGHSYLRENEVAILVEIWLPDIGFVQLLHEEKARTIHLALEDPSVRLVAVLLHRDIGRDGTTQESRADDESASVPDARGVQGVLAASDGGVVPVDVVAEPQITALVEAPKPLFEQDLVYVLASNNDSAHQPGEKFLVDLVDAVCNGKGVKLTKGVRGRVDNVLGGEQRFECLMIGEALDEPGPERTGAPVLVDARMAEVTSDDGDAAVGKAGGAQEGAALVVVDGHTEIVELSPARRLLRLEKGRHGVTR